MNTGGNTIALKSIQSLHNTEHLATLMKAQSFLLLLGAELPLMGVQSFGLLNDIFPFPSIPDAGYPVFNLNLANILFDVILPSVLGSSL
jgi:hypothetical protein